MILIKNGRVMDPRSGRDEVTDLVISEGKICCIGAAEEAQCCGVTYDRVIDAAGKVVAPGLIDVHIHFRDPGVTHKEDIVTGANAAKRGGYTTVVLMANTKPVVDNEETLAYVLEKGKTTGINVLQDCCITKGMAGKELVDMKALREAGAAGFTDD